MQALRFGAFSPAQQAKLDAVTGGKNLRQAVLDSLQPKLTVDEEKEFSQLEGIHRNLIWSPSVGANTPDQAESHILNTMNFSDVFTGVGQQEFDDKLSTITSADEKRGFLAETGAFLSAGLDSLGQWPQTPTDKTVDALVKAIEMLKDKLKF